MIYAKRSASQIKKNVATGSTRKKKNFSNFMFIFFDVHRAPHSAVKIFPLLYITCVEYMLVSIITKKSGKSFSIEFSDVFQVWLVKFKTNSPPTQHTNESIIINQNWYFVWLAFSFLTFETSQFEDMPSRPDAIPAVNCHIS